MAILKDFSIPAGGSNPPVAPFVSLQPQSLTVPVCGNATFTVSAIGTAPLAYQWRFNGTDISGALTNTCLLTNAQITDGGNYTVVITNLVGSVTSSVAILTVSNIAPGITAGPASLDVFIGNTVAFSVAAAGSAPLAYQWCFNGANISGADAGDYSFNNAQAGNAGGYTVVVTNSYGSVTSAVAVLTVAIPGTNGFTGVLAGWNVSGQSAYGVSPLAPATPAATITVSNLTRGAGIALAGTAAARTWGGNGLNAASAAAAVTANDFATFGITANAGFRVSFSSISTLDYKRSNAGPGSGVLQYQVGSGGFNPVTSLAFPSTAGASLGPIDLSTNSALQNVGPGTNVTFRLVFYGATDVGGNWYLYDFLNTTAPDLAISGTVAPLTAPAGPPALAATLSSPGYAASQFSFLATGTAGSNYIVQALSSLDDTNWISLVTNASPFVFTETNADSFTQRFYRVKSQQ